MGVLGSFTGGGEGRRPTPGLAREQNQNSGIIFHQQKARPQPIQGGGPAPTTPPLPRQLPISKKLFKNKYGGAARGRQPQASPGNSARGEAMQVPAQPHFHISAH